MPQINPKMTRPIIPGWLEAAGSGPHFIHDYFSNRENREDDDCGPGVQKVKRAAGNVHVAQMQGRRENSDGSEGAQRGFLPGRRQRKAPAKCCPS